MDKELDIESEIKQCRDELTELSQITDEVEGELELGRVGRT
jgi:hypothetical protein